MHDLLRPLAEVRPLRDPMFIAGFADHAGATASAAVSYLVDHWNAELVAEIDPEEFFDFTIRRPLARMENGKRVLQWPASRLYVASPPGATRDVVLLAGVEPHLRWRTFCDAIVAFMHEVGVTASLTLGCYSAPTPHTRPVPLRLSAPDEVYGRSFGLEPTVSSYEGPTGIVGVLNARLARAFRTASLSTMVPFYVGGEQNPRAMIALIDAIDHALGTSTPLARLREQATTLDREAEQALSQSEPLRAVVRSLEQRFDGIHGAIPLLLAGGEFKSDLPSSDEVIAGLEQYLREQRGSGHGDAAEAR
jgi:predicted ATP-grasp superfamily ATP-dependent carboligase